MNKYVVTWKDEQIGESQIIFINENQKKLLDCLNMLGLSDCLEECEVSISILEEGDSVVDLTT